MADLIELSKQLRRAAEHVRTYGTTQKQYCARDDQSSAPLGERPTCMAGAVAWALTGDPIIPEPASVGVFEALRFISGHLPGEPPTDEGAHVPNYQEHVAAWNDAEGRTAGEVVEMLLFCAREAVECHFEDEQIAEHGSYEDWCEGTRKAHVKVMTALHAMGSLQEPLAVAS